MVWKKLKGLGGIRAGDELLVEQCKMNEKGELKCNFRTKEGGRFQLTQSKGSNGKVALTEIRKTGNRAIAPKRIHQGRRFLYQISGEKAEIEV